MNTVTVKVYEYDEKSGSLIAAFASDTTKSNNPDDYERLAYQPATMWPDANTSDEIMTELAKCGIGMCEMCEKVESLEVNEEKQNVLKSLVNTSLTKNVSDLLTDPVIDPE